MTRELNLAPPSSEAASLLLRLAACGVEFKLADEGDVLFRPVAAVSAADRARLHHLRNDIARLLDHGTCERLTAFRGDMQRGHYGPFLYKPDVAYAPGSCFSCGARLSRPDLWGRCTPCSIAWRMAAKVADPAPHAFDVARNVA